MVTLPPSLDPAVEEGFFLSTSAAWHTGMMKGGE
jgi:hypothetical protein